MSQGECRKRRRSGNDKHIFNSIPISFVVILRINLKQKADQLVEINNFNFIFKFEAFFKICKKRKSELTFIVGNRNYQIIISYNQNIIVFELTWTHHVSPGVHIIFVSVVIMMIRSLLELFFGW